MNTSPLSNSLISEVKMQLIIIKTPNNTHQDAVILNGCVIFCDATHTEQVEKTADKLSTALSLPVETYNHEENISQSSWDDTLEKLKNKGVIISDSSPFLVNDIVSPLVNTADQYKTLCASTSHLTPADMEALELLADDNDCNMITGRDTGFFVKIYEEPENNTNYLGCSDFFHNILLAALSNGYRMVEFDSDSEEYEEFPVFQ